MATSAVPSNARSLHLTATTSEASTEQARHIIEVHAVATAAEHGLHTLLSTAPQGASHLSAATPLVAKKLALHVIEGHDKRSCRWTRFADSMAVS